MERYGRSLLSILILNPLLSASVAGDTAFHPVAERISLRVQPPVFLIIATTRADLLDLPPLIFLGAVRLAVFFAFFAFAMGFSCGLRYSAGLREQITIALVAIRCNGTLLIGATYFLLVCRRAWRTPWPAIRPALLPYFGPCVVSASSLHLHANCLHCPKR